MAGSRRRLPPAVFVSIKSIITFRENCRYFIKRQITYTFACVRGFRVVPVKKNYMHIYNDVV